MEIEKSDGPPLRSHGKERPDYAQLAEQMQVNDKVKTGDSRQTEGLIRALERRNRRGTRRVVDGELWVWRTQ